MPTIQFFFGVGSRYSYLAAARLPEIEEKTGAEVVWHPLYSPDLISFAGGNPFDPERLRGQYLPAYRATDAKRWAAYLNIPYVEPDFTGVDLKAAAFWAVAAGRCGHSAAFANAILNSTYAAGRPPATETDFIAICNNIGICAPDLLAIIRSGEAEMAHAQTIQAALMAGCFGVPTFVTDDGATFWGQDRIPLLVHHLTNGLSRKR